MMNNPIIGITLDSENSGDYSDYPYYVLRKHYFQAVIDAGGTPIALPHHDGNVNDYLNIIDGLLISGGDFDIDPTMYGQTDTHEKVTTNPSRTSFEHNITQKALELRMPILGICGGQQLLNVILGGTLIQHIPDEIPNAYEHEQKNPKHETSHSIKIEQDTLLHKIIGSTYHDINSTHHQAVKTIGPNMIISAYAGDGVIEAIEYPDHPFCLGVQWHPEYQITAGDKAIFTRFINAAS